MNNHIKKELDEFKKYHKNFFNIYFHIFCGFIFISLLALFFDKYSNMFIFIYSLLILLTTNNISITFIIIIFLLIIVYFLKKYKIPKTIILFLFIFFYFLPDLSHYLTKEKTILNIYNITPYSLFFNILYLLPLSLLCIN